MKDSLIQRKLREISDGAWGKAIAKCYDHINLKLFHKTSSGAHCSQRLGMDAKDFYLGGAIESLFLEVWEWKFDKYSIDEQLIRVIDSKISEEVRKYKVELTQGRKTHLVEDEQLALFSETEQDSENDEQIYKKFQIALEMACLNNEKYLTLIDFKKQNLSYSQIERRMEISKEELYRMMENVSRRARKILESL